MKIALLDGNSHNAGLLAGWLRKAGHGVVLHDSGQAFVDTVHSDTFDLLIVGPRAAEMSSIQVMLSLREHAGDSTPVLRLLERNNENDMVAALNAGADDCMVTPPRRAEFFARIDALVRRVPRAVVKRPQVLTFDNIRVDLKNRAIRRNGQRIALTPKSYDLAIFFFSNLGQLLSRSYLMERIWGRSASASTRTLDTHISRLRVELSLTPENGWQLQSVYQHGYRLEQTVALEARAA